MKEIVIDASTNNDNSQRGMFISSDYFLLLILYYENRAVFGHFRQNDPLLTLLMFELHIQIVPQKTTFFI